MKAATKNQVIKWYEDGLSVHEIVKLIPQYCGLEIEAVIKEHRKKKEWERLTGGSRHCSSRP